MVKVGDEVSTIYEKDLWSGIIIDVVVHKEYGIQLWSNDWICNGESTGYGWMRYEDFNKTHKVPNALMLFLQ